MPSVDEKIPTLQQTTTDAASAAPPPRRARGGAPRANTNAARHGCTLGELPKEKGLGYVVRLTNDFRRRLEAAVKVFNSGADPTLLQAVHVDAAAKHHRASLLAFKWLRDAYTTMKPEERIRALDLVSTYTDRRNAAIAKLGLAGAPAARTDADEWAEAMELIHGGNK